MNKRTIIQKIGHKKNFHLYYFGTGKDAQEFFENENFEITKAIYQLAGLEYDE